MNFDNVIFDSCFFNIPCIEDGFKTVDDSYYVPTVFGACTFIGKCIDCDLEYSLFEKACFISTSFENCTLQESILEMCALSDVEIKSCNLRGFRVCHTDILDLFFSDERTSLVNEDTFIDYKIDAKKEPKGVKTTTASGWKVDCFDDMCRKKAKTLKEVSRIFEANNLCDLGGEYFFG